jgi:hypothetical protein
LTYPGSPVSHALTAVGDRAALECDQSSPDELQISQFASLDGVPRGISVISPASVMRAISRRPQGARQRVIDPAVKRHPTDLPGADLREPDERRRADNESDGAAPGEGGR